MVDELKRNWRELLKASRDNYIENFGKEVFDITGVEWVYNDLEELFEAHEPQRETVDVEALKREALDHVINPDNLSGVRASDINMIFSGARRMFDYMHSRNLIRGAVPEGDNKNVDNK